MKKYIQIVLVLGAFFTIVLLKNLRGSDDNRTVGSATSSQSNTQQSVLPSGAGQYKDGTYTGEVMDAFYGNIQVQAVITNGKLSDVIFLQYPNDNNTSKFINTQAMPMLKSEAIQAQSATVDIVSGASDSSAAFQKSLASALQKAS